MYKEYVAEVSKRINAPVEQIWSALINPETIKKYMFGTHVSSEWKEGSEIQWHGEWEGEVFEEKGIILLMIPENMLQYSRYKFNSSARDSADNFNTITIELINDVIGILVNVKEDNNPTVNAKEFSEKVWNQILNNLKELMEK